MPFHLVVEPQEENAYREYQDRLLLLPENDQGLIFARNWMKAHSIAAGCARHWQLDDNIRGMIGWHGTARIRLRSGVGLAAMEDFCDRYENVAVAGPNYGTFAITGTGEKKPVPFALNVHVYSASLILNSLPLIWRSRYNDDTDFCLQALASGWCTVLFHAFLVEKLQTMHVKGGNTPIYQADGRLKMARALERLWPGVVETKRRFHRPQHMVKADWKKFDTPLRLKPGIDLAALPPNDYGLKLVQRGV